jgi:hypothetical protein
MVENWRTVMKYVSPSLARAGSARRLIQGIGSKNDGGVTLGNGSQMLSSLEEPSVEEIGAASRVIQGFLTKDLDPGASTHMNSSVSSSLE